MWRRLSLGEMNQLRHRFRLLEAEWLFGGFWFGRMPPEFRRIWPRYTDCRNKLCWLAPQSCIQQRKKKLRWLFHFKFSIFTCSLASEFIQEKFSHNVKTGENEISKPFFLPEWNVVSPVCPRGPEVCDNSKRRSLCRHRRQHHSALSGWFPSSSSSSASSSSSWSSPSSSSLLRRNTLTKQDVLDVVLTLLYPIYSVLVQL